MKYLIVFLAVIANFAVLGSWIVLAQAHVPDLDIKFAMLFAPLFLWTVNHISRFND